MKDQQTYEARSIVLDDSYWYAPSHTCRVEYRPIKRTLIQRILRKQQPWRPVKSSHHVSATIFGSKARSWKETLSPVKRWRAEEICQRIEASTKENFPHFNISGQYK